MSENFGAYVESGADGDSRSPEASGDTALSSASRLRAGQGMDSKGEWSRSSGEGSRHRGTHRSAQIPQDICTLVAKEKGLEQARILFGHEDVETPERYLAADEKALGPLRNVLPSSETRPLLRCACP